MTWNRLGCAALLWLGLGIGARAQETIWRPARHTQPELAPASPNSVVLDRPEPLAQLGRPMPVTAPVAASAPFDPLVAPASFHDNSSAVIRAQAAEPPPPPPPPPPGGAGVFNPAGMSAGPMDQGWWDKCKGWFDFSKNEAPCSKGWFESDHCFDYLASPVTSPFFFEDPRSLTELKPIIIYQHGPKDPNMGNSNSEFIGLQGRLALTEHWSIVMNKIGLVGFQPDHSFDSVKDKLGLSEINIGPKWTFVRNDCSHTVAAVGLTFQFPIGSKGVFQDTGNLGLDPYLSIAQSLRLPGGFGSFNLMGTFGYDFAVDSKRTEFTHVNLHLDYDIANTHTIYPLLELNWYHITKNGNNSDLGFEGGDLINFGSSTNGGKDLVTLAAGARWKIGGSENFQFGGAVEFPMNNAKQLTDFRLTFDLIFRY